MLFLSLLLDAIARPRPTRLRHWRGMLLHGLMMTALFGVLLAGSGNVVVSAVVGVALVGLFVVASNAKNRMLGEPIVFSDLALLAGIVRHPRFYFTAITLGQRWMLGIGAGGAVIALALLFSGQAQPHLIGAAVALAAGGVLALLLRGLAYDGVATRPDLAGDFARYGMLATLLLYWWRWRGSTDPAGCAPIEIRPNPTGAPLPELIVVVQCESFCDPLDITDDPANALPGLAAARAAAWQWGTLDVSGFGAYTMRTEYGVLFGRAESALGFRRYDPFLTAAGEASYALSARLKLAGYRSLFVHPHDLRFYNRDRLMPAVGFDAMIGEDALAPRAGPGTGGRYVDDRALGGSLIDLIDRNGGPTLLYTVTMENHGPWDSDTARDAAGRREAYLRHLRNSDAMLRDLTDHLARSGRPALLVFFGDHRPSIPGVTAPGGARHTPYVMLRFDSAGAILPGAADPVDLSPAALHHRILDCLAPQRESARVTPTAV
ncbi:LTA synthase family protein [Sphingomonas sp. PAMC 26617]|uniref:LTA synthase family protein n=1 Tax=Sphingomonas sp. PAMC 26617 TaxID=1112216 RepID=UPI0002890B0B|nr:LTA synthase family protein [Sphingomonas sp. PAMC 26617]